MTFFSFTASAAQKPWKKIIEEVKSSIVMIDIEVLSKLENENPGCYQGTGFIIDSKRGIILTNRHVIGAGPSTAKATFENKEKIEIKAVYYDPLHDFGFYKYNPSLLKWIKPKALKFADSDSVKIGDEIRVLGNNASEGLTILEGTVSWIKKNAPSYSDPDTYRDFNTYYFQTSADVSGGSSGGPIINQEGEVIAINSSAKRYTTVSWGLHINTVKNAFEALKKGRKINRGWDGASIVFSPFNEITDYGFPKSLIKGLKKADPSLEGLLTVHETIPGTDSFSLLRSGDVIWEINGIKIKDSFSKYENILNSNINKKVRLKILRKENFHTYYLKVIDIEKLKINSFLRIGGDYFSNIPVFMAFSYNMSLSGVLAPSIKYNFSERVDFPEFTVINLINGVKVRDITDFAKLIRDFKDGDEVQMSYIKLKELKNREDQIFTVNWKWFKPAFFKFDGNTYEWIKIF